MQHDVLGHSDIRVSKLCLGTMTWGQQNSEDEAHAQLDFAVERGINFIDTAEMYPVPPRQETQGATESYIGSWLQKTGSRDRVVLATKAAGPGDWLKYIRGGPRLNESHLVKALNGSLQRLRTDYVDLYQLHWPERSTNFFGKLGYEHQDDSDAVPLRETLQVIKSFLSKGKIRTYGLSNETPWGLMTCIALANELDMPAPVSVQNPYNLLNRTYEVGLAECSHRENVGLLAYSPLAFGVLTGKYLNGKRPPGARITLFDRFSRYTHERAERAVSDYVGLAEEFGMSAAQLALAFVNGRGFVTSNIIGATSLAQLEENINSVDIVLTPDILKRLEMLHMQHTFPCP